MERLKLLFDTSGFDGFMQLESWLLDSHRDQPPITPLWWLRLVICSQVSLELIN